MKTFTVEREVMRVAPVCYEVASDGSQLGDEWETDWVQELTTGFTVHIYDDDNIHHDTEFYPVMTDTKDWTDNAEEILTRIKQDFPPSEYQNYEW